VPHPPSQSDVSKFIESTFASVWALDLLLFLKGQPDRNWPRPELVAAMRASDSVVDRALEGLEAAGLILLEEDGSARYSPSPQGAATLVDASEKLYAKRPDRVRRMIILSRHDSLSAFADAFRLRRD
jgi:hypothetical protein